MAAAVQDNSLECLRILLACSYIEVDRGDECGLTPLHHAARMGHCECIEALLAAGASTAQRSRDRSLPLHLAAAHDQLSCLRILLRHGDGDEHLDACDSAGLNALQLAQRSGASECVQELLDVRSKREAAAVEEAAGSGTAETDHLLV